MKLSKALDKFLVDEQVRGCTSATLRHYRTHIGFFINFYGDKEINSIVYEDYEKYILYLKNKYKESSGFKGKKQKLSGRTIKTYASALKTFLKFCFDQGYMNTDISLKIKMPKYYKKMISILSDKEIEILLNSCSDTFVGSRNLLIIAFILESGLRLSEVSSINTSDIDRENNVLNVHGKGQKDRLVPLTDYTIYCLCSYFDNFEIYFSRDILPNEILLKCDDGSDISKNTISLIFRRLRHTTGISNLHPHLLRHTFATKFLLNGGDIANLQIILGHTTLNMVLNYLHIANQISISKQKIYSPISNMKNLNGQKKH